MSTFDEIRDKTRVQLEGLELALSEIRAKEAHRLAVRAATLALDAANETRRVDAAKVKIHTLSAKVAEISYRLEMLNSGGNAEKQDEIRAKYGKTR